MIFSPGQGQQLFDQAHSVRRESQHNTPTIHLVMHALDQPTRHCRSSATRVMCVRDCTTAVLTSEGVIARLGLL
ncbi:MAG: hypothetical protein R3F40_15710 [Candidatus Competibacteraceae bacterium]